VPGFVVGLEGYEVALKGAAVDLAVGGLAGIYELLVLLRYFQLYDLLQGFVL
jgi:hypothetical protein